MSRPPLPERLLQMLIDEQLRADSKMLREPRPPEDVREMALERLEGFSNYELLENLAYLAEREASK